MCLGIYKAKYALNGKYFIFHSFLIILSHIAIWFSFYGTSFLCEGFTFKKRVIRSMRGGLHAQWLTAAIHFLNKIILGHISHQTNFKIAKQMRTLFY